MVLRSGKDSAGAVAYNSLCGLGCGMPCAFKRRVKQKGRGKHNSVCAVPCRRLGVASVPYRPYIPYFKRKAYTRLKCLYVNAFAAFYFVAKCVITNAPRGNCRAASVIF